MRLAANQILLISAAGILAVGAGLAANIAGTAPKYQGPDTASLQALAARLDEQPLTAAPELQGLPRSVSPGSYRSAVAPKPRSAKKPAPRPPAPKPVGASATGAAQIVPAAKDEAVKNIALTGVTDGAGQSLAWFVDISNNDRQTAEKGSAAFGFTVKEIHADSVLLTKGTDEFLVRMGDKQVPSVAVASYDPSAGGGPGGFGPGGFGPGGFGPGGFGGRGDRGGGSDFMQRIADFRSRFGGGGWGGGDSGGRSWGGGGRSWGGGDSGGRSWGGGDSGRSNVSTTSNSGRSWGGGGFGGGGFSGGFGGFGGGGFSGFGNRGNSGRTTQTAVSTSNPQQARRSGGRLVGGATAMPTPDPISNPQTQRRTGSTSGQAFGDETANSGRNGFNNNSSRTSSYGNRGR